MWAYKWQKMEITSAICGQCMATDGVKIILVFHFWLSLVEILLRFSVGFGTLMRKWEIFPKHSFPTVFRNCSPILFLNSQPCPHHLSDFLRFSNNTLTFCKAKNENIWHFSKALIFQILSECLEGFFEFFRFSQNCRVLSSAGFEENKSNSGKI